DRPGSVADRIAGVGRRLRLEQRDPTLFFGNRAVADAAGHDEAVAFGEQHVALVESDPEPAPEDEEELVLGLVLVPDELAPDPGDLEELTIQRRDHARRPELGDLPELGGEIEGSGDGHAGKIAPAE